jgi:microsomal dipeptidase-like Zn-dependent dipeptidase
VELGRKHNDGPRRLMGFVDLHTHPVNHISFGGKVFHGAPDTGIWMPKDMRGCGTPAGRAASMEQALGNCAPTHKAVASGCGDILRNALIRVMESENGAQSEHGVHPQKAWPAYHDITHQQMWVDWIERAYKGGLRVMVGLVTNNRMLGDSANGENADDPSTVERAIPEIERLARQHPWMEVARTAADVRRIVGQDKLAVVLGIEIDDVGNMMQSQKLGVRATDEQVRAHIRKLHALGVRYAFPVHVVDNVFGGTAVYRDQFDMANRYMSGYWWSLDCREGYSLKHSLKPGIELVSALKLKMDMEEHAELPPCSGDDRGHVNRRGLTRRGEVAIDEMMRLGMFIDVDHMSHVTVDDTIEKARAFHGGYPLVSGHSSLMDVADKHADPEKDMRREDKKLARHYQAIRALGGLVGIEWDVAAGAPKLDKWLEEAGRVMAYAGTNIAFGTDINGMVVQPAPPPRPVIAYDARFPKSKTGNREWDYNRDGMAHYGLIADTMKHLSTLPETTISAQPSLRADRDTPRAPGAKTRVSGADVVDALYGGAEAFAATWERAESKAAQARAAGPERLPPGVREIPSLTVGPLCPTKHTGDREFAGHGPDYTARVQLRIVDGAATQGMKRLRGVDVFGSAIVANVFMRAHEVGGDTRAEQSWDVVVAAAPQGVKFERILGGTAALRGEVSGRSPKGGFQFIVKDGDHSKTWITPDSGAAVDEFRIVGDTGGPDISKDEDCDDDTSVMAVLNPIRVETKTIDTSFDAVDVLIETGGDDIRGGPGSAFVSITFAGGQTREIDVTHLGKGAGKSGTVRVPLGRRASLADLRGVTLRHVSNNCFACTTDYRDVKTLGVSVPGAGRVLTIPSFRFGHTARTFSFR